MTRGPGLYWFAVSAMVLSAAAWGLGTVATKHLLASLEPMLLLCIQLGASVTFLWLMLWLQPGHVPRPQMNWRVALSGLLEPGMAYMSGMSGLALTSAASASVIGSTEPMAILLLAWIWFGQRPKLKLVMAILAGTLGVGLFTTGGDEVAVSRIVGDLLVFAGVVFAALYVLASSRLVQTYHPLHLAALQHSAGLILSLGALFLAWGLGLETPPDQVSLLSMAQAAGTGILQYALAFWLYLKGMQTLPVQAAAFFLLLIPVFGISASTLFLGESLGPAQWTGCLVVFLSLLVVLRSKQATSR